MINISTSTYSFWTVQANFINNNKNNNNKIVNIFLPTRSKLISICTVIKLILSLNDCGTWRRPLHDNNKTLCNIKLVIYSFILIFYPFVNFQFVLFVLQINHCWSKSFLSSSTLLCYCYSQLICMCCCYCSRYFLIFDAIHGVIVVVSLNYTFAIVIITQCSTLS